MGFQHPQHGWRFKECARIGDLHPARRDDIKPWDARFVNGIRWTRKISDKHFDQTWSDAHSGVCEEFVQLRVTQVGIDEENRFPLTNGGASKACGDTGAAFGAFSGCNRKGDATRHTACDFIVELVVCGRNGPDAMACRGYICQHSELEVTFYLRCIFRPPGSKAEIKHSLMPIDTPQEVCHIGLSVSTGAGWRLFLELYQSCADGSFDTADFCHCRI